VTGEGKDGKVPGEIALMLTGRRNAIRRRLVLARRAEKENRNSPCHRRLPPEKRGKEHDSREESEEIVASERSRVIPRRRGEEKEIPKEKRELLQPRGAQEKRKSRASLLIALKATKKSR